MKNIKSYGELYYVVDQNGDAYVYEKYPIWDSEQKKWTATTFGYNKVAKKQIYTPEPIPIVCISKNDYDNLSKQSEEKLRETFKETPSENIQCEGDVNGKKDAMLRCIKSYPDVSNTEIAKKLKKAYPDFFANVLTESVRKQVGKLRSNWNWDYHTYRKKPQSIKLTDIEMEVVNVIWVKNKHTNEITHFLSRFAKDVANLYFILNPETMEWEDWSKK